MSTSSIDALYCSAISVPVEADRPLAAQVCSAAWVLRFCNKPHGGARQQSDEGNSRKLGQAARRHAVMALVPGLTRDGSKRGESVTVPARGRDKVEPASALSFRHFGGGQRGKAMKPSRFGIFT